MQNIITNYTAYNLWANRRMVDMLSPLSEAEMEQEIISSFPSVKTTLLHIWDAEMIWLRRLQGESLDYWPSFNFEGTQADLFKELLAISEEFYRYSEALTDPDADYSFKTTKGTDYTMKRSHTIHHCMNHSTFHRGQLITMLRQLTQTGLVSTDFITYLREN